MEREWRLVSVRGRSWIFVWRCVQPYEVSDGAIKKKYGLEILRQLS